MIFFLSIELSEDKESILMNFTILEISEKLGSQDKREDGASSPLRGGKGL